MAKTKSLALLLACTALSHGAYFGDKKVKKHCAGNRFPVSYATRATAEAACAREGPTKCSGVYDVSCNDRGSWYLCKMQALRTSGSSCVYQRGGAGGGPTPAPGPAWPKHTLSHCAGYKIPNQMFQSLADAQGACLNLGSACSGVYDPSCNNRGTFYLCSSRGAPWSRSSSSCVFTPPVSPPPTPGPPTPAPTPKAPSYDVTQLGGTGTNAAGDPMCSQEEKAKGRFVCGGNNFYDCSARLIEAYCGTMANACCSDTDLSCKDGDDNIHCLGEPPTPPPTPAPRVITVPTTMEGYDAAAFTAPIDPTNPASLSPLDAYRFAFAEKMKAYVSDVWIHNIRDHAGTRRALKGRRLAAGVKFDVEVTAHTEAAATTIKTNIEATTGPQMLAEFTTVVDNSEGAGKVPAAVLVVDSQTASKPAIVPPFYIPPPTPPPTPKPGTYEPSATVKTLHGYMKSSGGVTDVWDPKLVADGAVKVSVVAAAAGAVVLALYLLFVFCQCFCRPVQCLYKKSLNPDHTTRAKVIQTLLFIIFGGLMLSTVKGRDSFHQAVDIVELTLTDTATMFTAMEDASANMKTQSASFNTALTTLENGCDAKKCDACRWAGQAPNQESWEQSSRDAFVGATPNGTYPEAGASGGAAKDFRTFIAEFKAGGEQLATRLGGTAGQLRSMSAAVGADGKKAVDVVLVAMLVPGILVLVVGLLGTWCLHAKKTSKGCCSTSTFLMFFAQVFGALYVVMLIIFISLSAGSSVLLAEVCHQPVPETAFVEVLQEDNMVTNKPTLKPEDFDVPTLNYYLTCKGSNKLEDQVRLASAGVRKLEDKLNQGNDCDFSSLSAVVPGAVQSVGTVQSSVECPNINYLLTRFTREGVCTHMVDGVYSLWTVQAACGVFLLFALVMMRLVQQTFHNQPKEQPPTPTPVAHAAQQQIGSVQVFQQQNAQNTV